MGNSWRAIGSQNAYMSLNLNDPTATVVAAGLAALLALVSTVTTIALDYRRRNDERVREASRLAAERDQGTVTWLRKELHESATEFLSAAFEIARLSKRAAQVGKPFPDAVSPDEARRELVLAHDRLRDSQTSLRMLATASLVQVAEDCHDAHDELMIAASELGLPRGAEWWEEKSDAARTQRARFVTAVREPLGLEIYEHTIRKYGGSTAFATKGVGTSK